MKWMRSPQRGQSNTHAAPNGVSRKEMWSSTLMNSTPCTSAEVPSSLLAVLAVPFRAHGSAILSPTSTIADLWGEWHDEQYAVPEIISQNSARLQPFSTPLPWRSVIRTIHAGQSIVLPPQGPPGERRSRGPDTANRARVRRRGAHSSIRPHTDRILRFPWWNLGESHTLG